jgi:hypothetical protein
MPADDAAGSLTKGVSGTESSETRDVLLRCDSCCVGSTEADLIESQPLSLCCRLLGDLVCQDRSGVDAIACAYGSDIAYVNSSRHVLPEDDVA